MQNYYKILNVEQTADLSTIKKAYKSAALENHPDKHPAKREEKEELFKLISEAYAVLSDEEQRKLYDEKWNIYNLKLDNEEEVTEISGQITCYAPRYSQNFLKLHKSYVNQYQQNPLNEGYPEEYLEFYQYELYKDKNGEYHPNIFSYIKNRCSQEKAEILDKTWTNLSANIAIELFIDFLNGKYFGESLYSLIKEFLEEIRNPSNLKNKLLITGIKDILILATKKAVVNEQLILAIDKITDFAKANANDEMIMNHLAPLFQSKYFRHLCFFSLNLYWLHANDVTEDEYLKLFDREENINKMFDEYKEKLAQTTDKKQFEQINRTIRLLRCLHNLEKDFKRKPIETINNSTASAAKFYRDKAFLMLDWFSTLLGLVDRQSLINTLLQTGLTFQKAAKLEQTPAVQMADERLALQMYLIALGISDDHTPDIESYASIHCLKYILHFKFNNPDLKEIVPALQKRAFCNTNIFPFFQQVRSNLEIFGQENRMLILLRQLLHILIEKVEETDPEYISILYKAYEACLKNWYDINFNPATEAEFRLKLMKALLHANNWTFNHIKLNLTSPSFSVPRDQEGWMRPNRTLNLPTSSTNSLKFFSSINWVELDYTSGDINFAYTPWQPGQPSYAQLLSSFDIYEICQHDVSQGAIFSLNPPDPERPYHPFNVMWFRPASLYQTQLMHMMFITDYLLKSLTVGRDVQGIYPFAMKSVADITKNLPPHLKKIIDDFHAAKREGALHRFWIEADDIIFDDDTSELDAKGIRRILLGEMKMIVKKHSMKRNVKGELIDTSLDNEGWNIYVVNQEQLQQIKLGYLVIENPAIILLDNTKTAYFYEDHVLSDAYTLTNCDRHLPQLFKMNRDTNQKINSTKNADLEILYRFTNTVAAQTKKPHHFSPEYIFAREFTKHYNEFAIYFPELGRLRELSKEVVIVRLLHHQRKNNLEAIKLLEDRIQDKDKEFYEKKRADIYSRLNKAVRDHLTEVANDYSTSRIQEKVTTILADIRNKIGSFVNEHSDQVKQIIRQHMANSSIPLSQLENMPEFRQERTKIVLAINKNKIENLKECFKEELSNLDNSQLNSIITAFLNNQPDALTAALLQTRENNIQQQLQKSYPEHSLSVLGAALNGDQKAIQQIVEQMVNRQWQNNKNAWQVQLNKLKKLDTAFTELGLAKEEKELDLEGVCLWVPAAQHHEVERNVSHLVYGGVSLTSQINNANSAQQAALATQRANQARENYRNGIGFEREMNQKFRDAGYQVKEHVMKQTPFHERGRVIDAEIWKNGQCLGGVEYKGSMTARYTKAQFASDEFLRMNGYSVTVIRKR